MKKFLSLLLLSLFFLKPQLSMAAGGSFAGGSGSSGSPYQIEDCLDLQAMNSYLTSYFILNGNIDCSASSGWNSGSGFMPIGDGTNKFTGVFNGNGKVISDLYINKSWNTA